MTVMATLCVLLLTAALSGRALASQNNKQSGDLRGYLAIESKVLVLV